MEANFVDWAALPLATGLGVLSGWAGCRGLRVRSAQRRLDRDSTRMREVLSGFQRVADVVVSDIRSHQRSLSQLTDELSHIELAEAQYVAQVVKSLMQANQLMEQRLVDAESRLEQLTRELEARSAEASTDGLTNLANRHAFNEELARRHAEHQRNQRPLTVLFIDVDRFKMFNDNHGHLAGDAILRGVAAVLRQTVRGMDMVARYGGEEFAVILPNTPLLAAVAVAERAHTAVERMQCRYEGALYRITVSAGVAELKADDSTSLLLNRADACLYASKAAGRNCTHYHTGQKIYPAAQPAPALPTVAENQDNAESAFAASVSAPETAAPAAAPSGSTHSLASLGDRSAFCHSVRSRLAEWKRGGERLCVALAGIDNWPANHPADAPLRDKIHATIARQLVAALREMDLVGTYTSDCFGLLLVRTGLEHTPTVTRRLHDFVQQCTVVWNNQPLRLQISLGVAEVQEGDDLVQLIGRAERALRIAREAGGGQTFMHNGQEIVEVVALTARLPAPTHAGRASAAVAGDVQAAANAEDGKPLP